MRQFFLTITLSLALTGVLFAGPQRVLDDRHPAEGLAAVRLVAADGEITVTPSDDDRIHVRLEARARPDSKRKSWTSWFVGSRYEDNEEVLEALQISVRKDGDELIVRALPLGSTREDGIFESWTLRVPERLALDLRASSAEVTVSDLRGGVRLRQGHGDASIDVPHGDIDAAVQVGTLRVTSRTADYGTVELRSQVGKTKAWLDGRRIERAQRPGPGEAIRLEGRGTDHLDLRVTVGSAELHLEGGAR